ncbi:MAG TPA: hypothetical protein VFF11_16680, partial [Candidatus Binatia bacterium]|nr:hypothetical protein [Candidatus Binatia bacterium]
TGNTTYYFAATTYNAQGIESDFSNEAFYQANTNTTGGNPPPVDYQPPTLDPLANISINENSGAQTVNLTGISLGTGQTLTITAVSSNPSLIPNPTVNYVSPAGTGTLSFVPAINAFGSAVITVTVNNGLAQSNTLTRTFTVNVADVNPPTLDPVGNKKFGYNSGSQTITLGGVSAGAGNDNRKLKISAVSSNPQLVANPQLSYNMQNGTCSLVLSPMAKTNGTVVITVTLDNQQPENNVLVRTFTVTVAPNQPPTLDPIADVTLAYNGRSESINLTGIGIGAGDENQGLRITAVSSDPTVVPNPGGAQFDIRTGIGSLSVGTVHNASGTATITVTVDDGQPANNVLTRTFKVTVLPNQPPTLDPIADVTLAYNSQAQVVNLTGLSVGSTNENQGLRITAVSSDTTVVPNPGGG